MESGECQSGLNENIRKPLAYNSISGTGESTGERLSSDLGFANSTDALKKLRAVPAGEILKILSKDPTLSFDAILDGWIVPKQPAKIFEEGKQARVPVLTGSNADEATVFDHNDVKTVGQYRKYLQQEAGEYADREFQLYPVTSDSEVPAQYLRIQNDSFGYGAYSIARAVAGAQAKVHTFTTSLTWTRTSEHGWAPSTEKN